MADLGNEESYITDYIAVNERECVTDGILREKKSNALRMACFGKRRVMRYGWHTSEKEE